jgi:HSP20 family protein
MANLSVRQPERGNGSNLAWEPLDVMRQMLEWDPFREMTPRNWLGAEAFLPQFDVKETPEGYVFKADLPGIDEKDLDVSITGTRLTVSGKREAEKTTEDETFYACERRYGTFSRSFTLPDGVDGDHVEAELRSGVLTVHVPKTPEVKPRKVSIKGVAEKVRAIFDGKEKASA